MQIRSFTLGIALLMLTGVISSAEAKTRQVHCKGSGSFADGIETNIDTDGNGVSAVVDQGIQNCNIGRFFFQEETEWIFQPTVTTCPAGTTYEFHIDATQGQHRSVVIDEKTSDQLFGQITSGVLCYNASTFTYTNTTHSKAIGGTGKYAGATGTFDGHASTSYLQLGVNGITGAPGGFGQFTFTTEGSLTLPNDKDE